MLRGTRHTILHSCEVEAESAVRGHCQPVTIQPHKTKRVEQTKNKTSPSSERKSEPLEGPDKQRTDSMTAETGGCCRWDTLGAWAGSRQAVTTSQRNSTHTTWNKLLGERSGPLLAVCHMLVIFINGRRASSTEHTQQETNTLSAYFFFP